MEYIRGTITGIAFGGNGIIRKDGFVVFVPFTAVGDDVTCRIITKKTSYAIGELVTVHSPSENRVPPPCPYFGRCGGCQLQHINYPAQLDYKQQSVEDALKRIGHLNITSPIDIIPASEQWSYRRHIQLTLKPDKGYFTAGYIGTDNHSLVSIETCPIFNELTDPIIKQIQEISFQLVAHPNNHGKVTIMKKDAQQYVLAFHFKQLPPNCIAIIEKAINKYTSLSGATLQSPHEQHVIGQYNITCDVNGMTLQCSPHAFLQNHPEQSANIYHAVTEHIQKIKASHVLDLYCGIGVLTLLLAKKGIEILGVENNPIAVALANENLKWNKIDNAQFICANVDTELPTILDKHSYDAVIVNPPRQGLQNTVVETLLKHKPENIIYISCMPATLARDLAILCKQHYTISTCTAFDMFPQTSHIETMITLRKQ